MKGGFRIGAGRPKGVRNKRTREAMKKGTEGISPVDFLLGVMRDEEKSLEDRLEAAKSVAPYVHPKLAQTELNVNANLKLLTDDQLDRELLELLKDPEVAAALGGTLGKKE